MLCKLFSCSKLNFIKPSGLIYSFDVVAPLLQTNIDFNKLELYVDKDLFPSNDFDIVDIISFIKLYFPNGSDYNETIRGLMKEKEINNDKFSDSKEIEPNELEKITKDLLRLVQDYENSSKAEIRNKVKQYVIGNLK